MALRPFVKKKPAWLKKAENEAKRALEAVSELSDDAKDIAVKKAKEIDEKLAISEYVTSTAERIKSTSSELNEEFHIEENLSRAGNKAKESIQNLKGTDTFKSVEAKSRDTTSYIQNEVIHPVAEYLENTGIQDGVFKIGEATVSAYGKTRAFVKPYFAPETPHELLESTKDELLYINACILQINRDQAEILANRLGAAITSKLTGAATVGGLLGLVSVFGTAGTGTAIASLSGAAATNATLAWVGGLLGGGMAAGAAMTGGLALAISVGVYKLMGSEAREFDDLSDVERRVVEATGFLIAIINEVLEDPEKILGIQEAELLLENTLKPLHNILQDSADDIAKNLDLKNRVAFKEHAIVDFENQIIDGFEFFITEEIKTRRTRYPEFAISGVIYALLTQTAVDDSRESQLALEAIRRVRNDWNGASEPELSSGLSQYDPEQIRGLANNAKGIYHEMLFVENYNNSNDGTYAEMHLATNHPGSDVMVKSKETDEIVVEYQLKATSSDQIIREHFEKYPDIDVLATEEIATKTHGVNSSGLSNEEITDKMDEVIADTADNTLDDRIGESASLTGLAAAGLETIEVLSGRKEASKAGIDVLKSVGVAATSTALVAYLFG
jgi:hypothetical protein